MKKLTNKLLLIGWDAADWKFLSPFMEEGLLPNLAKLVEGGVKGNLTTLDPPLSPMLWTSIATGKRPYQHGIHGFTEPRPGGKGVRPIHITNRKVKAIWNILTQHDYKTHVVGWWPSHPAEPINGVMVSNFFQQVTARLNEPWPLTKGTVHPEHLSETFARFRVHPKELTAAHIVPFVPNAEKVDQKNDNRLQKVAKITAHCSSLHSATTYILENEEWDFVALYLDAIDHYCHEFMQYHPPRLPHVSLRDFELYKDVIKGACIYHDMMLGRLMELAGEDCTIMLISDHGFHPDNNRPSFIPKEPIGPTIEHSPNGIFVAKGPGIKKDELVFGTSILDIAPTILTLFGLPIGEDMDGKVQTQIFDDKPKINTIGSWENMKGEDGTHPKGFEVPEEEQVTEVRQLIELGYIEDPGDDLELAAQRTLRENNFLLARAYIDGGKWNEALEILEQLFSDHPDVMRYSIRLSYVYQQVGRFKDARKIVDYIREHFDRDSPYIDILEGHLLLEEQRFQKALNLFKRAEQEAGFIPRLNFYLANAYYRLNRFDEAESCVEKELKLDPKDASSHHILGLLHYKRTAYDQAVDAFMQAISLNFYFPASHFYLGETLLAKEQYEAAAHAFEICLHLVPELNIVRQRLITIFEQFLDQPGKAFKYRTDFENKIKGELVVVSGLPRSGTSLIMQMLQAGGIPLFTDEERKADENNPNGFFEHEAVKKLAKNKSWLSNAEGKAVKVIAQLLNHLPRTYRYKVIFIERDLMEIIQSQQRMLHRSGKAVDPSVIPLNLVKTYRNTLRKVKEWTENQPNVEVLFINHQDIIYAPFEKALAINDFLGGGLRVEEMAGKIDVSLYREKIKVKVPG